MTAQDASRVPRFGREFFGAGETFTRIGAGALGGKASGLDLVRSRILNRLDTGAFPGLEVCVPTLTVLTTAVFDAFVQRGELRAVVASEPPDDRLAHAFQQTALPAEFVGDLRALIAQVRSPLAVRSSSLLEDALEHPFAGVYGTKMIPNNQADVDARFQRLTEAVKYVYASTYFRGARHYVRSVGQDPEGAEKMAVIVQEVLGRRQGDRFYPTVSGVARSYNYYPTGHARPTDGVVSLALGLGKQIVDGGLSWSFALPYPNAPPPFGDARDVLRNTQKRFYAVNIGRPPLPDPIRETEFLVHPGLDVAESDGTLRWLASTYDPQSDAFRPGVQGRGARALTFAPLLRGGTVPLVPALRQLVELSEEAVGAPVELEFALNLDPRRALPARLGFLQVRPMMVTDARVAVEEADLSAPDVVVASTRVMGNGERFDLHDVIYLKPGAFAARHTPEIARELEAVNRQLTEGGRPYVLIGFGRWGSSDPWLGVPVEWAQINGARVIVEAALPNMNPDPSQGSHFFHNLISFRVLYLTVPNGDGGRVDWAWLDARPARSESAFVRHVHVTRPLAARVDGRQGRGVVTHGGTD